MRTLTHTGSPSKAVPADRLILTSSGDVSCAIAPRESKSTMQKTKKAALLNSRLQTSAGATLKRFIARLRDPRRTL
jgi:hypothetical protein